MGKVFDFESLIDRSPMEPNTGPVGIIDGVIAFHDEREYFSHLDGVVHGLKIMVDPRVPPKKIWIVDPETGKKLGEIENLL